MRNQRVAQTRPAGPGAHLSADRAALGRLEAQIVAQRIEQGIDQHIQQAGIMLPDRRFERAQRLFLAASLCVNLRDVFGVGEHHRADFADASPAVILAAAAAQTSRIRLTSAVSVLSAADPVRLFQDFATLDLVSRGRAEMIVGRGSFGEAHALFGVRHLDYDALFAEKLDLLLQLRTDTHPHWRGKFRPLLSGQGIYPRPHGDLHVWVGVGGTPQSFARAGTLGLPLMVAIIGGSFDRFRPLVDLYREAGLRAGHAPERLRVGLHAFGFVAETPEEAREALFAHWFTMVNRMSQERGFIPIVLEFDRCPISVPD